MIIDNTKKYKKYSNTEEIKNTLFLLRMLTSHQHKLAKYFFLDFLKLLKVLSVCAQFPVFGILLLEIK